MRSIEFGTGRQSAITKESRNIRSGHGCDDGRQIGAIEPPLVGESPVTRHLHAQDGVAAHQHNLIAWLADDGRRHTHGHGRHAAGDAAVIIRDHHLTTSGIRPLHIGQVQALVGLRGLADAVDLPQIGERLCASD